MQQWQMHLEATHFFHLNSSHKVSAREGLDESLNHLQSLYKVGWLTIASSTFLRVGFKWKQCFHWKLLGWGRDDFWDKCIHLLQREIWGTERLNVFPEVAEKSSAEPRSPRLHWGCSADSWVSWALLCMSGKGHFWSFNMLHSVFCFQACSCSFDQWGQNACNRPENLL